MDYHQRLIWNKLEKRMKISTDYLRKTSEFLESLIVVNDTNDKKEIKESKNLIATFTPSKKKFVIKRNLL